MPVGTSWLTPDRAATWRDLELGTSRAGDVTREISDDAVSITIMRGDADLDAQSVRLLQPTWPPGRGRDGGSTGGEEAKADLVVLGGASLDIQRGDRFFADSQLYEVVYVAPEQEYRTEAGARQVQ